jgi:hypothetical protein
MIKAYKYLFYKLFKFWEFTSVPKFWSDMKAALSIDILVFFIVLSCMIYFNVFINPYINFGKVKYIVLIFILLISIPNYFIFNHRDQWKKIVHEFDKLPSKENNKGGIIVLSIVLLIIINLIFAFYLMSQIDWKQYR